MFGIKCFNRPAARCQVDTVFSLCACCAALVFPASPELTFYILLLLLLLFSSSPFPLQSLCFRWKPTFAVHRLPQSRSLCMANVRRELPLRFFYHAALNAPASSYGDNEPPVRIGESPYAVRKKRGREGCVQERDFSGAINSRQLKTCRSAL